MGAAELNVTRSVAPSHSPLCPTKLNHSVSVLSVRTTFIPLRYSLSTRLRTERHAGLLSAILARGLYGPNRPRIKDRSYRLPTQHIRLSIDKRLRRDDLRMPELREQYFLKFKLVDFNQFCLYFCALVGGMHRVGVQHVIIYGIHTQECIWPHSISLKKVSLQKKATNTRR